MGSLNATAMGTVQAEEERFEFSGERPARERRLSTVNRDSTEWKTNLRNGSSSEDSVCNEGFFREDRVFLFIAVELKTDLV